MIPMPTPEQWQVIADLALIIVTAAALLALAGLPVMGVVGQTLSRLRQRSSYDKCARQLGTFAACLGWLLTIGGAVLFWWRQRPLLTALEVAGGDGVSPGLNWAGLQEVFLTSIAAQADVLVWLLLICGTLCISLYASLWRTLRNVPALHQTLALLGTAFCYAAVYGVMAIVAAEASFELGEAKAQSLRALFLPRETSPLWNGVSYLLPLTLTMAGGLGALWLVARRHRDDYGRDHYTQMLPWCAVWARNSWMVLWLLLVGFTGINLWYVALDVDMMPMEELIRHGARLLLWLIPGLLWTIVARSSMPMRHRFTLLLAVLLAMGFIVPVYMGLISDLS